MCSLSHPWGHRNGLSTLFSSSHDHGLDSPYLLLLGTLSKQLSSVSHVLQGWWLHVDRQIYHVSKYLISSCYATRSWKTLDR